MTLALLLPHILVGVASALAFVGGWCWRRAIIAAVAGALARVLPRRGPHSLRQRLGTVALYQGHRRRISLLDRRELATR